MSDGVNIDWSLGNEASKNIAGYASDYGNAFQMGRKMAGQQIQGNVMQAGGGQMQQRPVTGNAMASPLPAAASGQAADPVVALTPPQRQAASQRVELIGALASALASRPYEERGAILAHMAPALGATGLPAEAISRFDPTDEALEEARAEAEQWRGRLAPARL